MHQLMTLGGMLSALGGVGTVLLGLVGVAFLEPNALESLGGNSTVMIGGGVGLIVGVPLTFIGLRLWADHDAAQERLI